MNEGKSVDDVINPLKKVTGNCPKCGSSVYLCVPNEPGVDFKYAKLKWTEERAETLRDETLLSIGKIQKMITELNDIKLNLELLKEEQCR